MFFTLHWLFTRGSGLVNTKRSPSPSNHLNKDNSRTFWKLHVPLKFSWTFCDKAGSRYEILPSSFEVRVNAFSDPRVTWNKKSALKWNDSWNTLIHDGRGINVFRCSTPGGARGASRSLPPLYLNMTSHAPRIADRFERHVILFMPLRLELGRGEEAAVDANDCFIRDDALDRPPPTRGAAVAARAARG
ncbi:hypothetical protein EVAR_36825_1 [Eumeta japonica]|uniref:Uncharacterized protein n=1 Tax=Eumeta variegata TaxID=151549 RepID=A0A4C1WBF2_EUMVA|nr:hypothetical protein EVAR_36825_1 [Eumeta japonica]